MISGGLRLKIKYLLILFIILLLKPAYSDEYPIELNTLIIFNSNINEIVR